jgi:predicted RNA binding protein with dsRBD fold (UPF0201 family)
MPPPDIRARLVMEARISPSEDPAKVDEALMNVAGVSFREGRQSPTTARLTTEDSKALVRVRDQLRDRHIRAAARRQMLLNSSGRSTFLMLNRQAAAAGVVALCGSEEESPLGPIYLKIESERLQEVIDWLTDYSG